MDKSAQEQSEIDFLSGRGVSGHGGSSHGSSGGFLFINIFFIIVTQLDHHHHHEQVYRGEQRGDHLHQELQPLQGARHEVQAQGEGQLQVWNRNKNISHVSDVSGFIFKHRFESDSDTSEGHISVSDVSW